MSSYYMYPEISYFLEFRIMNFHMDGLALGSRIRLGIGLGLGLRIILNSRPFEMSGLYSIYISTVLHEF